MNVRFCHNENGKEICCALGRTKKTFSLYKHVFRDNDLPPASDPVFKEIKSVLSSLALLLSVKKNFNYFFDVTGNHESSSISSDTAQNEECSSSQTIKFDFMIDFYQWKKILPIKKQVRVIENAKAVIKQKYRLPKHMWAHLLREQVWKSTKSPCL